LAPEEWDLRRERARIGNRVAGASRGQPLDRRKAHPHRALVGELRKQNCLNSSTEREFAFPVLFGGHVFGGDGRILPGADPR
jgi:hypothetical protein